MYTTIGEQIRTTVKSNQEPPSMIFPPPQKIYFWSKNST